MLNELKQEYEELLKRYKFAQDKNVKFLITNAFEKLSAEFVLNSKGGIW